jgi:hypothetical protein
LLLAQATPFDFGVMAHVFVAGLHAPSVWHWSGAAQALPQAPQFCGVVRSISQPSEGSLLQSPKFVAHLVMTQAWLPLHFSVATLDSLHGVQPLSPQP